MKGYKEEIRVEGVVEKDHENAPLELPRIVSPGRAERHRDRQFPLNQAESPQENKSPEGGFTRRATPASSPQQGVQDFSEGG
jgi:hypothetical protein